MVDVFTIIWAIIAAAIAIVIVAVGTWVVLTLFRDARRRRAYERAGTSHLDLYFDEHFPNLVEEFDLVTKRRFDNWASGVTARLSGVTRDIDVIGKARGELDARLDRLEKRLGDVE